MMNINAEDNNNNEVNYPEDNNVDEYNNFYENNNFYGDNIADSYKNNMKPLNKEEFSDISSNYSNVGNREMLIQNKNKKVIEQTRNYTSQSFFIDKNKANNLLVNNYQLKIHNPNELPMTMKGDFVSSLENNLKIMAQKKPRIQVTNAAYDLNQIMNNHNVEDYEYFNNE